MQAKAMLLINQTITRNRLGCVRLIAMLAPFLENARDIKSEEWFNRPQTVYETDPRYINPA